MPSITWLILSGKRPLKSLGLLEAKGQPCFHNRSPEPPFILPLGTCGITRLQSSVPMGSLSHRSLTGDRGIPLNVLHAGVKLSPLLTSSLHDSFIALLLIKTSCLKPQKSKNNCWFLGKAYLSSHQTHRWSWLFRISQKAGGIELTTGDGWYSQKNNKTSYPDS